MLTCHTLFKYVILYRHQSKLYKKEANSRMDNSVQAPTASEIGWPHQLIFLLNCIRTTDMSSADVNLFFPLTQFWRMYPTRPGRPITKERLKREISGMWSIVCEYESASRNDIATLDDNVSYYSLLHQDERETLNSLRAPSYAVAFVLCKIQDSDRSIDGDIAELRRLVLSFMDCEE